MAMVVKNNMTAINTLNTLNKNSSALSKSLQKVSSGMKINSAADDASGYAISERMRVQIRSLDQANQNTQNGSSMMKVAEGAVSSTVEILKTLKEKAVNAANDSNTDSDRQTIQKELDQSIDQINDNANVTFNGKYLVDGSKNSKGNATYTVLTNQSLGTETKATTKLTDLTARSGDSLEIVDTDKVTVSYVHAGKTYSTTFDAKDATLQSIFDNAEAIDKNSYIFAKGDNASVKQAAGKNGETIDGPADGARAELATKKTAAETELGDAATPTSAAAKAIAALKTYNNSVGDDAKININVSDYKSTADLMAAIADDAKYKNAATDATHSASLNGTGTNTAYSAIVADLKAAITGTDFAAYSAAKSTYDGKSAAIITGMTVGVAASGDDVTTASGENGISITADASGIGGQISGLNISITDSKGNVKKSANAALDAFSETIRAQNKSEDNAISLQVGASANQSIKVGLTDMRAEALGLKGADGTTLNISTQGKANAAINVLDNAIAKALDQQTTIGSVESRLEYTS